MSDYHPYSEGCQCAECYLERKSRLAESELAPVSLLADLHAKAKRLYQEMNDAWSDVDAANDAAEKAEEAYQKAHDEWEKESERLVG